MPRSVYQTNRFNKDKIEYVFSTLMMVDMGEEDRLKILRALKSIHPDPYGMGEEELRETLGWSGERLEETLRHPKKEGLVEGSEDLVFDFEDSNHKPYSYLWIRITQEGIDVIGKE